MSRGRWWFTGFVLVAFVSFNSPLLEAASGAERQQQVSRSKPKSRLMRSEKLKALGAERWAAAYPAGTTLKQLETSLKAWRDDAMTAGAGNDGNAAAIRSQIPRIDRFLNLIRILDTPAEQRRAALRQLPSAIAIPTSRPRPTSATRPEREGQQPDGSDTKLLTLGTVDLCEDQEGWSECAADEEILDATIIADELDAEVDTAETDLYSVEEAVEDHCLMYPEDCTLLYNSPASAPQLLPIQLESEDEGFGNAAAEPIGHIAGTCTGSGPEEVLTCALGVAASIMGIPTVRGEISMLRTLTQAAVRPTRRALAIAVASALGVTTAFAFFVAGTIGYCYFYAEPLQHLSLRPSSVHEPSLVFSSSR